MKLKRRANGKGSAIYLGSGRVKPWSARITLGLDENGISIRHCIGTFETQLEALFFLEQYHKNPKPLYIKTSKYNRIVSFSGSLYPLIPVDNPRRRLVDKINKEHYTFKQVFEIFKNNKIPTEEEMKLEKENNIKTTGKFSWNHASHLIIAYNYSNKLHNAVYKDLVTSDFQSIINMAHEDGYSRDFQLRLILLFKHLDNYAIKENVISRGYAQYAEAKTLQTKKVIKTIFSSEEITNWENLKTKTYITEMAKNIFIFALYSGCRVSEIIFLKNSNIFLDKGYMITGVKTEAGKNREIPIHKKLIPIIEKYYNKDNKFLFTYNEKAVLYSTISRSASRLMKKYPCLGKHTIHECRHTFRTKLEKLNIKQVIINAIVGHKNNDVGLDVYTHISIEDKIEAVKMIDY